jgi:hypothetical protein
MPPVLAQVSDDAFRARKLSEQRRRNRIGLHALPSLTDRGNVVNIYGQSRHAALPPGQVHLMFCLYFDSIISPPKYPEDLFAEKRSLARNRRITALTLFRASAIVAVLKFP